MSCDRKGYGFIFTVFMWKLVDEIDIYRFVGRGNLSSISEQMLARNIVELMVRHCRWLRQQAI